MTHLHPHLLKSSLKNDGNGDKFRKPEESGFLLWGISRDGRAFSGGASAAEMAGMKMAARGRGGKKLVTRNFYAGFAGGNIKGRASQFFARHRPGFRIPTSGIP